ALVRGSRNAYGATTYTSTNAVPVVPPTPETVALYAPAASETSSTASWLFFGSAKAPTATAAPAISSELVEMPQSSFTAMGLPPLYSVICGSARVPPTPNCARPGPTARTSTRTVPSPLITKPGISTTSPAPTNASADALTSRTDVSSGAP